MRVRHDVPASELTTLQVGGLCATVVDVETEGELLDALASHPDAVCIGGGSNLLVSDNGFSGTLIRTFSAGKAGIDIRDDLVRAEATVEWDVLVEACVDAGLQGLESTSGVPGSVGGAVVQNLGAYGQETSDVVLLVNTWDRQLGRSEKFNRAMCEFAYRSSCFKHDDERRYVVTSVVLQLKLDDVAVVRYGDVSELMAARHGEAPYLLADIRDAVLEVRRGKGMVLGSSDPSAGSFFTNPILSEQQAASLEEAGFRINGRGDGAKLVSAAQLMEAAGYQKGYQLGAAGLSEQHVLAIVNRGGATTADVVDLANEVRANVFDRFGVWLKPEPVLLGFEPNPFAPQP